MKKTLLAFLLAYASVSWSQCPTCNPDLSCVSADGSPTVCPLELPAAFSGEYYEEVLTFYMPASVTDPEFNIAVDLEQVTITSVTGLPFGLSYTTNNANGVYFPLNGENHGCATLCGTALIPGVYDVNINVDIIASVGGFEITDSRSFSYALIVEQGSVSTETFTYSTPAGCGETEVLFEATLSGTEAQLTTYAWDFGDGNTSSIPNPAYTFNEPGEYEVSLTTSIFDYTLQTVSLANINDNGDGDTEEFFSPPADPYFIITDGQNNTVFTSSTVDNSINPSWSNLNILLENPPYSIAFWDEDVVTSNDLLSTFNISLSEGELVFNSGDGTVGSLVVTLTASGALTNSSTITVFSEPDVTITAFGSILGVAEIGAASYQWYVNGMPIANANSQTFSASEIGVYSCEVVSQQGCEAISEDFVFCGTLQPVFDPLANEVYVDDDFDTYQWYYNGIEVQGATTFYLVNPLAGNYSVYVTNDIGCAFQSSVIIVPVVSIKEISKGEISIYPNPSNGIFTVETTEPIEWVKVLNSVGQVVHTSSPFQTKWQHVTNFEKGFYLLEIKTINGFFKEKVLID